YATDSWTFTDPTGGDYNDIVATAVAERIGKVDAVWTFAGSVLVYDGAVHTATGSCVGVTGEDLSAGLSVAGTTHTAAGDYATDSWTFTDPTGGDYNDIAATTVADSIGKADAVCTVAGYAVVYDGAVHTATGLCGGVTGEDLSAGLSVAGTTHTAAGDYATDRSEERRVGGGGYNDVAATTVADTSGKADAVCTVGG